MAKQWSAAELQEKVARNPTPERREAWVRIARKPCTWEEGAAAQTTLPELVKKREAMLETTPRLVGERYSLADIADAPIVEIASSTLIAGSRIDEQERMERFNLSRPRL